MPADWKAPRRSPGTSSYSSLSGTSPFLTPSPTYLGSSLLFSSGKGKTTKSTNEAEYRVIFEHLLTDVQSVLFWPEWPAAATFLGIVTKVFVNALDPPATKTARKGPGDKKGLDEDNSALKSIALDHLGVVAARLRKCAKGEGLTPLDEVRTGLHTFRPNYD